MQLNSYLLNLHKELGHAICNGIETGEIPYVLVVGAPASGKSSLLTYIELFIARSESEKFDVVRATLDHASDDNPGSLRHVLNQRGPNGKHRVILIDDLDKKYDPVCEGWLRAFFSSGNSASIIATSTTPVISGEFVLNAERRLAPAAGEQPPGSLLPMPFVRHWDKQQSFFNGSIATMPFLRRAVRPSFVSYEESIEREFSELVIRRGETLTPGQLEKLAHELLLFTGPFPPCVRSAIETIRFNGLSVADVTSRLSESERRHAFAVQCLDNGIDLSIKSAWNWTVRCHDSDTAAMLLALGRGEFDGSVLHRQLNKDLAAASLIWEAHDFHMLRQPAMLSAMVAAACCEEAGSRVTLVPSTTGVGGSLVVRNGDGESRHIDFSQFEFMVIRCLKDGAVSEVDEIVAAFKAGGDVVAESQVRSALARMVAKCGEADCSWIIENIPRKGYVLHLRKAD